MESKDKKPLDEDKSSKDTNNSIVTQIEPILSSTSNKKSLHLLDLCDDVIMHIFSFLNHDNIAKMANVCTTLSRISSDWTLWKDVTFDFYTRSREEKYINYLGKSTVKITIKGTERQGYASSITSRFLKNLTYKCPKLTHFSLRHQVLNIMEVNMQYLHPNLRSLEIDNTMVDGLPEDCSYIISLDEYCPHLEDVRLTFNNWFIPEGLNTLAQLEKLKYLSLQGCTKFTNSFPQISINSIIGFKNLQTLDLRFTPIYDQELVCFERLKSLKSLLLERPTYINPKSRETITDVGVSGFCHNNYNFHHPYVQILINRVSGITVRGDYEGNVLPDKCKIDHLYVRNYPKVTDLFLENEATSNTYMKTLDLTGTSCTIDGIEKYKLLRPDVKITF